MWLRRISSAGATHLPGFSIVDHRLRRAAALAGKSRRRRHGDGREQQGGEDAQQLHEYG
jgi:hypothetical protein